MSPAARSAPVPAATLVGIAAMPFSASPKPAPSSKSHSGTTLATGLLSRTLRPSNVSPTSSSQKPNRPDRHDFCPFYAGPPQVLQIGYDFFFDLDPQHRGLVRLEANGQTHTAVLAPSQK